MSSQTKIPKWVGKEQSKLADERARVFAEKGWKDFYKFGVGTTDVEVDVSVEPRTTKEGKPILRMKIEGKDWDVPVTRVMYQRIINELSRHKRWFKIIRVGEGKGDTRYQVVTVE